ncbi:MAG: NAD(P)H-binding protein [Chloroflexi bacterium]|nr:NAD(P)H-binding protein [Chloroflexota bacterium]
MERGGRDGWRDTGQGVAAELLSKGYPVRALVRDAAKAEGLRSQGAEVVVADLDDPSTLPASVFEGVDKVYLLTWNGETASQQTKNFLGALKASGATPYIVRLSAFGAAESRIIKQLRESDDDLKASGCEWTLLQPTFFMQNTMMAAQTVQEQGTVYFDWGDGKAGMVDVRDVVDSAVGVLTAEGDAFKGQSYVLTGPESIGFADVAAKIGAAVGKPVQYMAVPNRSAKPSRSITLGRPTRLPSCRTRSIPARTRSACLCFLAGSSYQIVSPASGPGVTGVLGRGGLTTGVGDKSSQINRGLAAMVWA